MPGERSGPDPTSILLEALSQTGVIQQVLGNMQGQLTILLDDRRDAAASRAALYQKIDKVEDRVSECESDLRTLTRIAPMVEAHERERQRWAGGVQVAGWIRGVVWAALGGVMVALGWLVNELPRWVHGPRP